MGASILGALAVAVQRRRSSSLSVRGSDADPSISSCDVGRLGSRRNRHPAVSNLHPCLDGGRAARGAVTALSPRERCGLFSRFRR